MHPQLQQLEIKAAGLLYLSETDAPFTTVVLQPGPDVPAQLLKLSGKANDAPVETVSLEHFFRNQVKTYPESSNEQKAIAARFNELQSSLQKTLTGLQVYRVGSVQIDAFIIGRLQDGTHAGLRTQLVET